MGGAASVNSRKRNIQLLLVGCINNVKRFSILSGGTIRALPADHSPRSGRASFNRPGHPPRVPLSERTARGLFVTSQLTQQTPISASKFERGIDYTPKGSEADNYRFYCPLCMLYFTGIYETSCCKNYICASCLYKYLKNKNVRVDEKDGALVFDLDSDTPCPHCAITGFQPRPVSSSLEKVRLYVDSANAAKRARPEIKSPVHIGDSFEDLKRKLLLYDTLNSSRDEGAIAAAQEDNEVVNDWAVVTVAEPTGSIADMFDLPPASRLTSPIVRSRITSPTVRLNQSSLQVSHQMSHSSSSALSSGRTELGTLRSITHPEEDTDRELTVSPSSPSPEREEECIPESTRHSVQAVRKISEDSLEYEYMFSEVGNPTVADAEELFPSSRALPKELCPHPNTSRKEVHSAPPLLQSDSSMEHDLRHNFSDSKILPASRSSFDRLFIDKMSNCDYEPENNIFKDNLKSRKSSGDRIYFPSQIKEC